MSDDGSINFSADDSIHIESPKNNQFSNFNHQKSNTNKNGHTGGKYRYVNVLGGKGTGKFGVSGEFQEFLAADKSYCNVTTASMLGTKKIGKSFLLDNILNAQTGQISRIMSRNREEILNSPTIPSYSTPTTRIIYFDNNDNPNPNLFLFLYYISSVMVYNLSPNSEGEEKLMMDCIFNNFDNIRNNFSAFSRPQLVIVRRDAGRKEIYDFDLVRRLQQSEIFQPEIIVLHMPYPGNRNTQAKQLIDVPPTELDPVFLTEVLKLHKLIQQARPKQLFNQTLTPQTLNLTMQSMSKSINNQQPINAKKIKDYMNEALAVGYYNNYLKSYSEELEKELANEEPCDKYTMYKKLNKIKRRVNKKMERYNGMGDEPIFQKYREKLQETIKSKEAMVKSVNQAKCREVHQKNCNVLVQNLNEKNYEQLIDQYCKSNLDDQKIEVLMENYQKLIKSKDMGRPIQAVRVSKVNKGPPPELINLDKQLQQLGKTLESKSKMPTFVRAPTFEPYKVSIENKKAQLLAIKKQVEQIESQSVNQAPFILKEDPRADQLRELDSQRQRLNSNLEKYDQQIEDLKNKKEKKVTQTIYRLKGELTQQEQRLKDLAARAGSPNQPYISQVKTSTAGKSVKKTCCQIM